MIAQSTSLTSGQLRVVFERHADRYGHAIELRDASGQWQRVLTSVEGTPDDDWPPSPPLQELHFEDRPDGQRVALLVGMAGNSHWSASVETKPEKHGTSASTNGAGIIAFDFACRLKTTPLSLGNKYAFSPDWHCEALAHDTVEVRCNSRGVGLTIAFDSNSERFPSAPQSCRFSFDSKGLLLSIDIRVEKAATAQWQMELVGLADRA